MSFNGSGVFVRLYSWVTDAANGIDIKADRMDNEMNGMATGLSLCLTRDGQAAMLAALAMGGFAITGLRDPVNDQDAATKKFVDDLLTGLTGVFVGPTAPASPSQGDQWYKTVSPFGLFVWVEDGASGAWKISTGDITFPTQLPPVKIADAAPTIPVAGDLWFKTSSPVGLFVWFTDVDSSQWVSVGANGAAVPAFATNPEAIAGTRTDVVMSPAATAAAIDALAIGIGQTWQNVLGSRAVGTSYQNLTGRSIMVNVDIITTTAALQVSVDNSAWINLGLGGSTIVNGVSGIIPPNHWYRVSAGTISTWSELR